MQNRSAIWIFTILLAIASIYQISFSFVTAGVESDADKEAEGMIVQYMDSAKLDKDNPIIRDSVKVALTNNILRKKGTEPAYPVLGFTYNDCLEREMKIGLDLKGGMNVTLEVSIPDLVTNLAANRASNEVFKAVMVESQNRLLNDDRKFLDIFAEVWGEKHGDLKLSYIFNNRTYADKFPKTLTDEQVIGVLNAEADEAIKSTERILRTRIDRFGVTQPTIQRQGFSGRILIELPGVKDREGVRKIIQSTANLEFFYTYANYDVSPYLDQLNNTWAAILSPDLDSLQTRLDSLVALDSLANVAQLTPDSVRMDSAGNVIPDSVRKDTGADSQLSALENSLENNLESGSDSASIYGLEIQELQKKIAEVSYPVYNKFTPALYQDPETQQLRWQEGCALGFSQVLDTAEVMVFLNSDEAKSIFPPDLSLYWANKANEAGQLYLYGIKSSEREDAPLTGETVISADQNFDQVSGKVIVNLAFNQQGSSIWKKMTGESVGQAVAIVLDNQVYSAPIVNGEIGGGRTQITFGNTTTNETIREAQLLATVLNAGSLPAPAQIVDEAVVGPSLGAENVRSGLMSFIFALVLVLLYMIFYYAKAGLVSNVALLANIFFLFGAMASLQASLTLPGIAGIVLTIGMSVDANVLIYERIREETRAGKGLRLAITDGYKRAYAAILDANITTFLTALVLFIFGSGPIKGFATTLMIGIATSLFSAIFITRLIFMWQLDRKKNITFGTKMTINAFTKVNFGFLRKRKIWYLLSSAIIVAGIVSLATRGLNQGVDFTGGRTYVVSFEKIADVEGVKTALAGGLKTDDGKTVSLEVKTIEEANKVKITTNWRNGEKGKEVGTDIENTVIGLVRSVDPSGQIIQSRSVDPTISDDIKSSAGWAIGFSLLIIFLYIVFRFRKWQFGLGALVAMIHDVLVVLGLFSLLWGVVPWSMEVDQAFIAAILTVVGYSINDTVVVFDRIREHLGLYKRKSGEEVVNDALNSTLSRTINTSLSTFIVLLVIFLFGGDAIKGFIFALMIGVVVGTYSSVCIATPLSVDLNRALRGKRAELDA